MQPPFFNKKKPLNFSPLENFHPKGKNFRQQLRTLFEKQKKPILPPSLKLETKIISPDLRLSILTESGTIPLPPKKNCTKKICTIDDTVSFSPPCTSTPFVKLEGNEISASSFLLLPNTRKSKQKKWKKAKKAMPQPSQSSIPPKADAQSISDPAFQDPLKTRFDCFPPFADTQTPLTKVGPLSMLTDTHAALSLSLSSGALAASVLASQSTTDSSSLRACTTPQPIARSPVHQCAPSNTSSGPSFSTPPSSSPSSEHLSALPRRSSSSSSTSGFLPFPSSSPFSQKAHFSASSIPGSPPSVDDANQPLFQGTSLSLMKKTKENKCPKSHLAFHKFSNLCVWPEDTKAHEPCSSSHYPPVNPFVKLRGDLPLFSPCLQNKLFSPNPSVILEDLYLPPLSFSTIFSFKKLEAICDHFLQIKKITQNERKIIAPKSGVGPSLFADFFQSFLDKQPNYFFSQLMQNNYFDFRCKPPSLRLQKQVVPHFLTVQNVAHEVALKQTRETTEHLVQRLRGGGSIKIPKKLLPKIDFEVCLPGISSPPQPNIESILFSELKEKLSTNQKIDSREDLHVLLDLSDKFDAQPIAELFEIFSSSESANSLTFLIALKTSNVPRDPFAILRRDTRAFVNSFKPFVSSAFLHLADGPKIPSFIVYLVSKKPHFPQKQILLDNGLAPPISGGLQRTVVETVALVQEISLNYREVCKRLVPPTDKEAPETAIGISKITLADCAFVRFYFACRNEDLEVLQKAATESQTTAECVFWTTPVSTIDTQNDLTNLLRVSNPTNTHMKLPTLSTAILKAAEETNTQTLALLPHDAVSMLALVKKNANEFISKLCSDCFLIQKLETKRSTTVSGNALMIYPVPNQGAQNSMSLQELKEIITPIFHNSTIEVRQKALRVHCPQQLLQVWRNFRGHILYQKVRMCKEKENDDQRKKWWNSLSKEEVQQINITREHLFALLADSKPKISPPPIPISSSSPPCSFSSKRPRLEESAGTFEAEGYFQQSHPMFQ